MPRLKDLDASVFVLDPEKPGVRYELLRQVFWSYPLIARSKGKELRFLAEGPEAREAQARLLVLFATPHREMVACGDHNPFGLGAPAQVPHPTESVPPWPNMGILRPLHEYVRRGVLAGAMDSMTGGTPDERGRHLLDAARKEVRAV